MHMCVCVCTHLGALKLFGEDWACCSSVSLLASSERCNMTAGSGLARGQINQLPERWTRYFQLIKRKKKKRVRGWYDFRLYTCTSSNKGWYQSIPLPKQGKHVKTTLEHWYWCAMHGPQVCCLNLELKIAEKFIWVLQLFWGQLSVVVNCLFLFLGRIIHLQAVSFKTEPQNPDEFPRNWKWAEDHRGQCAVRRKMLKITSLAAAEFRLSSVFFNGSYRGMDTKAACPGTLPDVIQDPRPLCYKSFLKHLPSNPEAPHFHVWHTMWWGPQMSRKWIIISRMEEDGGGSGGSRLGVKDTLTSLPPWNPCNLFQLQPALGDCMDGPPVGRQLN